MRPPRPGFARQAALTAAVAISAVACARLPPRVVLPSAPLTPAALGAELGAYTSSPVVVGNRVDLLLNGEQIFPAMLEAVRSARRTITFAQYAYGQGPVANELVQALGERCRAGVGVDVLLDGFGSLQIPPEFVADLRRAGCWVLIFHPLDRPGPIDQRNHRRILVIDGRVGFTGGAGVGRKWTGDGRRGDHWRDTDVRVEGPVVAELQRAFAENWREAGGDILAGDAYYPLAMPPRGPVAAQVIASSPLAERYETYEMFLLAIEAARRSVHITTPYFLPNPALTLINRNARIPLCGLIAQYNATELPPGPNLRPILANRAFIKGFIVSDHGDRLGAFLADCTRWLHEGRLKYREDVVEGLAAAPAALIGVLEGRNFGKKLVRVSADPTASG